jgi:hypothetical protein
MASRRETRQRSTVQRGRCQRHCGRRQALRECLGLHFSSLLRRNLTAQMDFHRHTAADDFAALSERDPKKLPAPVKLVAEKEHVGN